MALEAGSEPDALLAQFKRCRQFALRARELWTEIVDETGEVFARAATIWLVQDATLTVVDSANTLL